MTSNTRQHWLLLLTLAALAPAGAQAQDRGALRDIVLPGFDSQAGARLAALDHRLNPVHSPALIGSLVANPAGALLPILADRRNQDIWERMPEEYQRMMQESGDALVIVQGPVKRGHVAESHGQVRRLCQERLARLPRVYLDAYRQRVDAEARVLLNLGRQTRSTQPLRRLVDELVYSRYGDEAIELLGDLTFERGNFDDARVWWHRLAPPGGQRGIFALLPDPKVDRVRVRAKLILAHLFAGRLDEARAEIDRFQQRHPNAKGHFAGKDDAYGVTLENILRGLVREKIINNAEAWTTFGGDVARNRSLSQALSWQLWEDGPAWSVSLPPLNRPENGKAAPTTRGSLARAAAFHPVIVGTQVLIADHRSVISYHLTTGRELFRYDLKAAGLPDPGPGIDPTVAVPRFTLSADPRRAYIRLGAMTLGAKKEGENAEPTWLICLDLTEPAMVKKRELWRIKASADDRKAVFFEGAPLVTGDGVYIARTEFAGGRARTSIDCFDRLGRRRWTRAVCDCPDAALVTKSPRHRHHLLTWAGGQVVFASHAGAMVAIDGLTGQPTWGVRYPPKLSHGADTEATPRDLIPCVHADGSVYAAPLDTDRVFCIDAVTGQVIWEAADLEAVHLLGVSNGRLFVTTRTGLVALRTASGQVDWMQPSDGRLPPLGRGLIAGRWILWPTQDPKLPYRAVTLDSGRQEQERQAQVLPEPAIFDPTMLATLPVGNLAFGHGCLAIAGLRELVVYAPAHQIHQLPPADPRPQVRLERLYQRGRWFASAGRTAEALEVYRQLLDASHSHRDATTWHRLAKARIDAIGDPGKKVADPPTMNAELRRAASALQNKNWGEATDAFRRALRLNPSDQQEATSLHGLARAYEGQRDFRSAWHAWQSLDARFAGLIEPISKKTYGALVPSRHKEPYLSALAAWPAVGPRLPLVQAWEQTDGRAWPLSDPQAKTFFCTSQGRLTCRRLSDGAAIWSRAIDFEPTWLERWRDLVVFAGAQAVQAVRVHDGMMAWRVPAPSRAWRLSGLRDGMPAFTFAGAGFGLAQRWDDTLLLLDDSRRFLRLRLDTGEIAWQYAPPAAALRPLDGAAFGPHFVRFGANLFAQNVAGQPVQLNESTTPFGAITRPWVEPPRVVGKLLIRAEENGRIIAQHPSSLNEAIWHWQASWPTSLTGELCKLKTKDNTLLAAVPYNEGNDWVRLDTERGQLLWRVPARKLPDGLDPETVCLGNTSWYYAKGNAVCARSLNDGTLQWTRSLPATTGGWRIRYARDYLAVYPLKCQKEQAFFVSFLDPIEGTLLQRLSFPESATPGKVVLTPRNVLVSAAGRIFNFRSLDAE
ncbi:MAG: PQQ-binding-like beta-propeller repeat protein [Planctomycetes bacterium]|nr:PQQ-binding-like beta-propeller repeat protein [Planctomycetota bacterium]